MMGAWFLTTAAAEFAAAEFAKLAGSKTVGGVVTDKAAALAGYKDLFLMLGEIAVVVGIVLWLLSPIFKRGMHGIR